MKTRYALVEMLEEDQGSFAGFIGMFGGGMNDSNKSNLRFISNNLFNSEDEAVKWMEENIVPDVREEAEEKYAKMQKQSGIYDINKINQGLTKGFPLVARNIMMIPVAGFYSVKGTPSKFTAEESPMGIKQKREIGPDKNIVEFNSGKAMYTDTSEEFTSFLGFESWAIAELWLSDNNAEHIALDAKGFEELNNWLEGKEDENN